MTTVGPSVSAVDWTAILGGDPYKMEILVFALTFGLMELIK